MLRVPQLSVCWFQCRDIIELKLFQFIQGYIVCIVWIYVGSPISGNPFAVPNTEYDHGLSLLPAS